MTGVPPPSKTHINAYNETNPCFKAFHFFSFLFVSYFPMQELDKMYIYLKYKSLLLFHYCPPTVPEK